MRKTYPRVTPKSEFHSVTSRELAVEVLEEEHEDRCGVGEGDVLWIDCEARCGCGWLEVVLCIVFPALL